MQARLAPIARLGYLIIIIVACGALVKLAYGWSLDETMRFAEAVVGKEYAPAASWAIQLLPQALLVITAYITTKDKHNAKILKLAIYTAIALNLVDAATNIGAYIIWVDLPEVKAYTESLPPLVAKMTRPFGFTMAFAVTWAEEGIMLLVALGLNLIVETAHDFGHQVPAFFRLDDAATIARRASGYETFFGNESQTGKAKKKKPHPRVSRIRQRPPVPQGNSMRQPTGVTTTITPTSRPMRE